MSLAYASMSFMATKENTNYNNWIIIGKMFAKKTTYIFSDIASSVEVVQGERPFLFVWPSYRNSTFKLLQRTTKYQTWTWIVTIHCARRDCSGRIKWFSKAWTNHAHISIKMSPCFSIFDTNFILGANLQILQKVTHVSVPPQLSYTNLHSILLEGFFQNR